jgi:hypothetical protein
MNTTLMIFTMLTLVVGLLGLALVIGGITRLLHARILAGGGRLLFGLLFLTAFALVAAIALDLRTYLRLSYERPVATLAFSALGPQDFRVRLTDETGQLTTTELRGDDWQLDARVLKWKGLATVLGLDPVYRLERLEGRYRDTGQERREAHSVAPLGPDARFDLWSLAQQHAGWLPWVDAVYGSATYLPMADGAQYVVSLGNTGLLARPANAAAQAASAHW